MASKKSTRRAGATLMVFFPDTEPAISERLELFKREKLEPALREELGRHAQGLAERAAYWGERDGHVGERQNRFSGGSRRLATYRSHGTRSRRRAQAGAHRRNGRSPKASEGRSRGRPLAFRSSAPGQSLQMSDRGRAQSARRWPTPGHLSQAALKRVALRFLGCAVSLNRA